MGLPAAFCLALRAWPGLAEAALRGLSLPALRLLHRLTAHVPFPAAEPLALMLIAAALPPLIAAARALAAQNPGALRPCLRGLRRRTLCLVMALCLLWEPARAVPAPEALPLPSARQLEWLGVALIDALNANGARVIDPQEALRLAPGVAGIPGGAVKAARYPEWMRAANISGLFVPLTGEALVDAGAPAPLVPFTAVHELMHLSGIADEGAANIAAWDRCMAAGGAFADSARLWALRYALGLLRRADGTAWRSVRAKMEGALLRTFHVCGDEAEVAFSPPVFRRGDYAALAGYLIRQAP